MYLPDSTAEPVEVRGDVPAGADLRLLAFLVAGVALAVPISLFWHPVAWWSWVGAVALALGAGLVLSVRRSARETWWAMRSRSLMGTRFVVSLPERWPRCRRPRTCPCALR